MIDVSGSMSCCASNNMKGEEKDYFSRLALVKHSLKTVVSTMAETDKMSLIVFANKATKILEATNINEAGKNIVFDKIKEMRAYGGTNIWDALRLGLIEAQKYNNYSTCLMLFTDGEPNINPPMGIVPSLNETISDIKNVNFTISTFAFGYNVDSQLMEEIARIGNGIYGYCPDCTMVGTIFVNFMSNILTTLESTVKLDVRNSKLCKKFEIGGLYSGISRHLGFFMDKSDFKNTEITLYLGGEKKTKIKNIDYTSINDDLMDQYFRLKLINLLDLLINDDTEKVNKAKEVKDLYDEINQVQKKQNL